MFSACLFVRQKHKTQRLFHRNLKVFIIKNGLEDKKWRLWEEELAKKEGEWMELSTKVRLERQGGERVAELGKGLVALWNEVAMRVIGRKKIGTSKGKKVNKWWTQEVEERW